jgi:hypothetical protein
VKAFLLGEIVRRVKAWHASLPKKRYLIPAVFLVALGVWINSVGPDAVKGFCIQMVNDLGLLQPFTFLEAYFRNLTACDRASSVVDGEYLNCSWLRFINPLRLVGTLITTMGDLWNRFDGPGHVMLPLAMAAAFPIAISLIFSVAKRMNESSELHLLHVCFAALLTPVVASTIALFLQVLAIVLFTIFGYGVGIFIWAATVLAVPLAIWQFYESTIKMAKKLESITETIAPGPGSTDREKPK